MKLILYTLTIVTSLLFQTSYAVCTKGSYSMVPKSGEVKDLSTNLTWKRCLEGQSGSFCSGEPKKMSLTSSLELLKSNQGWRLPTHDELLTLVKADCANQSGLNSLYFPNQTNLKVWSSSRSDGSGYWTVNFPNGDDDIVNANQQNAVRLVK